jgi:glucose/arabinose dehydrogenase
VAVRKPTQRLGVLLVTVAALLAVTLPPASARTLTGPPRGAGPLPVAAPRLVANPILTNVPDPAAFTFLPDGRLLYGEISTGNIMLYDLSTQQTTHVFTVTKVQNQGEQGLLGLAVDPAWPAKPNIFAYATRKVGGQPFDEILRIKVVNDVGISFRVIWKSVTISGSYHDGGHIAFGPDGKLYAVVGEAHNASNAQDLSNDAGKVLRMTKMGEAPPDDPFPHSRIFAYGLRNSFGFAFDPQSGLLWETENGPECNDEINIERAGENHAWGPTENCGGQSPDDTNQDGPQPRVFPLAWFTPTIAPTGAAFCNGCGLTNAEGDLFFGTYNTSEIRQIKLTGDRMGISSITSVFVATGPVESIQDAPDGGMYFSTPSAIYQLVQA